MTKSCRPLAVLTLAACVALTGCAAVGDLVTAGSSGSARVVAEPPSVPLTELVVEPTVLAVHALAVLEIRSPAPRTGYSRDQFGAGWADFDGDGCDTRDQILARDSTGGEYGTDGCIDTVVIYDPYSNATISDRADIDIDHRVSLFNAWKTGAQRLAPFAREQLANDPRNLIAVHDVINRKKADSDAASFLPPNGAYRCEFVAHQIAVKRFYGLWVTLSERDAMLSVLGTCPEQSLPTDEDSP